MLDDVKEVAQHLRNIALVEAGEATAKAYSQAAQLVSQIVKNKHKATTSVTRSIVNTAAKLRQVKAESGLLTVYSYAARMLEDIIDDHKERV